MLIVSVCVLNFAVNFLLIIAIDRIMDHPVCFLKAVLAAMVGGIYGGVCLLPGCSFLGGAFIYVLILWSMCLVAWGVAKITIHKGLLFILFNLAITGIATAKEKGTFGILFTVIVVATLGFALLQVRRRDQILHAELCYGGRKVIFDALKDTGNGLKDPLTGQSVLVVDSTISQQLTGLRICQLQDPITTIQTKQLPGMRLIQYRSIGNPQGFLLGMRIAHARLGSWKGSLLVAFAPHVFCSDGKFQALAGGSL